MRSWTLFFPGNYPNEAELIRNPEEATFDKTAIFWVYVLIFVLTFVLGG